MTIRDQLAPHMAPIIEINIPIILPTSAMKEGDQGNQAQKLAISIFHCEFEARWCKKEINTISILGYNKYAQFAYKGDYYYGPVLVVKEPDPVSHDSFPTASSHRNGWNLL